MPRKLHLQPDHPISITRRLIESRFPGYKHHNDLPPVVSVAQNFDALGFPSDHPGRDRTDTYYVNASTVLRTHTSAHQLDTFRKNLSDGFTISADVYRRDEIDRSHYPVFHQMEGAMTWDRDSVPSGKTFAQIIWDDVHALPRHNLTVEDQDPTFHSERNPLQAHHSADEAEAMAAHLKKSLELVVQEIFSKARSGSTSSTSSEPLRIRWVESYFPFTSPSYELEVLWNGTWLEILGCGIVSHPILKNAGVGSRAGWAFGLGLERLAMLLFEIPDIRLFWSRDDRFLSQFRDVGKGDRREQNFTRFVPFSKYPAANRDVAFWLPDPASQLPNKEQGEVTTPSAAGGASKDISASGASFHENDIMEIVREVCADTVETVSKVDEFTDAKTGRRSLCYRIVYRSLERTLTKPEVKEMHDSVCEKMVQRFGVQLR